MKFKFTIIFALAFTALFAQKNQYSIDMVRPDSIFLIEKTFTPVKESPRPKETVSATLYKSLDELIELSKRLKEQAENYIYVAGEIEKEVAKQKATAKN